MPSPIFKLAVYGPPGDVQATLSSYDLSGESKAFVQEINAELDALPRARGAEEMRKAAVAILRRRDLVGPDAGGWYARA